LALKLLRAVTSAILRQDGVTVSNDNGKTSFYALKGAGAGEDSLSPAIKAALATIGEVIAAAREEGRNARERELLALTDRDFILISRQEYDRLNWG
jgi:hypothetical protein